MKKTNYWTAGLLAAALASSTTFAQDAEGVKVKIRATAAPEGTVTIVEETDTEAKPTEGKETTKPRSSPIRDRVLRLYQQATEKVGDEPGEANGFKMLGLNVPTSEYWIGVQIEPLPEQLRKHLSTKHGILVALVFPESPAAKAELKTDDILLQAGDTKLETGADLIKAVDAAKEGELLFTLLREGKETTATIKPIKRAAVKLSTTKTAPAGHAERLERLRGAQQQFERALEALRAETANEGPEAIDLMMVRPGAFMFGASATKLPDDVTIQMTREGNQPAKIHVKQGDKSWDITADKLDELPKELRPHVQSLLGGMSGSVQFAPAVGATQMFSARVPHGMNLTVPAAPGAVPGAPAVPFNVQIAPGAPPAIGFSTKAGAANMPHFSGAWTIAPPLSALDAKVDQVLKKLDALASPDLESMKAELKSLRKEVDELRKSKNESNSPTKE
ncbi:hypothetical protein ETAA8_38760 [Anatilimnocola aggregata]|uniref:PDZ domain-containing protein n=1 Tax=Anatilimnocola aggregata TaxID=2528021 RepID=A0A517YEZ1_9BACT|nr:hypothetical protein ETAA8_38760 [Anatilimnocola aggregata]